MNNWINRIREYWNDKKLADQCGLQVKDICAHEKDYSFKLIDNCGFEYIKYKCKKCGEFYR